MLLLFLRSKRSSSDDDVVSLLWMACFFILESEHAQNSDQIYQINMLKMSIFRQNYRMAEIKKQIRLHRSRLIDAESVYHNGMVYQLLLRRSHT